MNPDLQDGGMDTGFWTAKATLSPFWKIRSYGPSSIIMQYRTQPRDCGTEPDTNRTFHHRCQSELRTRGADADSFVPRCRCARLWRSGSPRWRAQEPCRRWCSAGPPSPGPSWLPWTLWPATHSDSAPSSQRERHQTNKSMLPSLREFIWRLIFWRSVFLDWMLTWQSNLSIGTFLTPTVDTWYLTWFSNDRAHSVHRQMDNISNSMFKKHFINRLKTKWRLTSCLSNRTSC